jgi:hypothetical protein
MEKIENKIDWSKINFKSWKPNLIQRLLIKLGIIKDKRFNASQLDWQLLDEAAHFDFGIMNKNKSLKYQ